MYSAIPRRNVLLAGCLLMAAITILLCLSFLHTSGSHGWSTSIATAAKQELEDDCEPWKTAAHLNLNITHHLSTSLRSYDPSCQASNNWVSRLKDSVTHKTPLPELMNKELLLVGDSVDRRTLSDVCVKTLGLEMIKHPMHSFAELSPDGKGGIPHTCRVEHLNLTMHNYFFYGFDEADMWKGVGPYNPPGKFTARFEMFEKAVQTLPSGGRPDLVIVNVGLWELLRHHVLYAHKTPNDPVDLFPEFQEAFLGNTVKFLKGVRRAVGQDARIRFRENHTPGTDESNIFTSPAIKEGKKRVRYTGVRIDTMNALIDRAIEIVNTPASGTGEDDEDGVGSEGDDIRLWPVGKLMRPWPWKMWVEDDCHPKPGVLAGVWGEGMLEYLARAPRVERV